MKSEKLEVVKGSGNVFRDTDREVPLKDGERLHQAIPVRD